MLRGIGCAGWESSRSPLQEIRNCGARRCRISTEPLDRGGAWGRERREVKLSAGFRWRLSFGSAARSHWCLVRQASEGTNSGDHAQQRGSFGKWLERQDGNFCGSNKGRRSRHQRRGSFGEEAPGNLGADTPAHLTWVKASHHNIRASAGMPVGLPAELPCKRPSAFRPTASRCLWWCEWSLRPTCQQRPVRPPKGPR